MNQNRKYFGLDQLDRHIAKYVTSKTGVFVELGAYDGVRQNNTLYFERLGWRGVLIEPNPASAQLCRENRPLAKVFECACIATDDPRSEIEITACGLMTIVTGARGGGETEDEWIARGEEVQSLERSTIKVPARTIQSVLDEAGVTTIDMLIVDVEGYEIEVLKGLDFTRNSPEWIVGEDDYNDNLCDYLTDLGYKRIETLLERKFTRDVLYKRT